MDKEKAIQELLMAVNELYTHYWESDDPRSNPVSFEISEVYTLARLVKSFNEIKIDNQIKVKNSKNKLDNLIFIPKTNNIKKGDK